MRGVLLVVTCLSLGGPAMAQDLLNAQHRAEARRHYEKAEELMVQESFEPAVQEFRAATRLDPRLVLAHYGMGQALMALKRYPEAAEAYTNCRDAILSEVSLDQRTRAEMDRARRDEIEDLEQAVDRLRTGKVKGVSSEMSGAQLAAEERLRLLKNADMRGAGQGVRVPAEVSVALGSALFRMGRLDDAERNYRAALLIDGKNGAAHNNLAVIFMMTGRLEEAQEELKRAEKSGFSVSPAFKKDLEAKRKAQAH